MRTAIVIWFTVCSVLAVAKSFRLESKQNSILEPLILGGSDAKEGQFPYQALFRSTFQDAFICGGSILTNRFILTSAVHFDGVLKHPQFVFAIVGTIDRIQGGVKMATDKIIRHEQFNLTTQSNNVCLIRTAQQIVFTDAVQPIALPTHDISEIGNVKTILTGWGWTEVSEILSNKLKQVKIFMGSQNILYIVETIR